MKLWITYAWVDNEQGNFDFLVQELKKVGVDVNFDRVALIPGQRLWEQIAKNISDPSIDGWAYLLTPKSLSSQPCREELAYALDRALATKGGEFPLFGLVGNGLAFKEVPDALRTRLCIPLASENWKEQIVSGLEQKPTPESIKEQSRLLLEIKQMDRGNQNVIGIQITPRFEELRHWRFVVPAGAKIVGWGSGAKDSWSTAGIQTQMTQGGTLSFEYGGKQTVWTVVGAGDVLSHNTSAYLFLAEDSVSDAFAFGIANEPFAMPEQVEIFNLK